MATQPARRVKRQTIVDDVAAALRVAPGAVKSSLFDARQRLRTTLFEEF
jgi:hypothetical protein